METMMNSKIKVTKIPFIGYKTIIMNLCWQNRSESQIYSSNSMVVDRADLRYLPTFGHYYALKRFQIKQADTALSLGYIINYWPQNRRRIVILSLGPGVRNHQQTLDARRTHGTYHTFRTDPGFLHAKITHKHANARTLTSRDGGTDTVKKYHKIIISETKTKSLRCRVCHYHGRRHIATTFRCPPHHEEIIKTSRKITARLINTDIREQS